MVAAIADFYAGCSIFVIGFTGFMGRVLVEKLLRSCSDIKAIYVLIRPKNNQDVRQRLEDVFSSKLFDKLRKERPEFRTKVIPVNGNMLEPHLGMSQSDMTRLVTDVSVVFHAAATANFEEHLKSGVLMNLHGVKKLAELCKQMSKLEALVYVSTVFANCDRSQVQEAIYPPALQPQKLMEAAEWMDAEMMEILAPHLIGKRPNTYTYIKAMVEYLLVEEYASLPIAIIRPSIVGASLREPFPGWLDNFDGPTNLLTKVGKGILRSMMGNVNGKADVVPIDLVINLMIASAWYTSVHRPSNTMVYNLTTGNLNKATWGHWERYVRDYFLKNPLDHPLRVPRLRFTTSSVWFRLNHWIDHDLRAYVLDFFRLLMGRQPCSVQYNESQKKTLKSLDYFTLNQWEFSNDNLVMLWNKVNKEDQSVFNFNVKSINWPSYVENYCLGVKRYFLKEELSGLPGARRAMKRLQYSWFLIKITTFIILWCLLAKRVAVARALWQKVIFLALFIYQKLPSFAKSH
ncbi:fatty acyl-CoA reductase 1-like [Lingula anatina]|uniref:Fatty acyl-CoA reductase n=1 Tax=Lingula anatina TaxID=7574 RepID=A0A1S3IYX8_LINAN|nr:fatty acyl-CoA reductase 1-like [Lingula anatina]XP_013403408.1 fatty acyl-CoA reductase 1-like [Lingula anatina]XP_023932309.1 fatty acyl-CoA reductase 1-like [Lingula anatina]|eukprot:XP_013403407.1 fatty acyl-CoA reductase 1-like [Lingula anatina]